MDCQELTIVSLLNRLHSSKSHRTWIAMALITCTLSLTLSCRSSGQAPGPYQKLDFSVDSTRLGEAVAVGEMTLQAPRDWQRADSTLMSHIHQGMPGDTSRLGVSLEEAFVNAKNGAVLLVTSFANEDIQKEGFVDWARRFAENFYAANPYADTREEWLLLGDIPAVQLYAADSLRVQFKFLLDLKTPMGLDYSVPLGVWTEVAKSVESSLGTIRKR